MPAIIRRSLIIGSVIAVLAPAPVTRGDLLEHGHLVRDHAFRVRFEPALPLVSAPNPDQPSVRRLA